MKDADIISNLQARLSVPGGRHLYGVLGTYPALEVFARNLEQARVGDGDARFPAPLSVDSGILDAIPDEEFRALAQDEAKLPQPVRAHVSDAFKRFLRDALQQHGLVTLAHLELLFAYSVELTPLRTLATDDARVILLLPGRRDGERTILFPEAESGSYTLPPNLIAENHLWELT